MTDVVIVLLDCARGSEFPGPPAARSALPNTQRLLQEGVEFSRSATVAPWTIPSHASLFTGRYPWVHGAHARNALKLDPSLERLPRALQRAGYRTVSLSANPFISPEFDLVRGFDSAQWAGWWESFVRLPRDEAPQSRDGEDTGVRSRLDRAKEGQLGAVLRRGMHYAYRFVFLADAANRVANRLRVPGKATQLAVAPWIESALGRELAALAPGQPLFAFINLVDAHEPYYPADGSARGVAQWWKYAGVRQDYLNVAGGKWRPTREELDRLRALYRQSLTVADERIGRIRSVFERADRWDDTLFVLTSDHGQAFGEDGLLFHMFGTQDSLLRIPMIVKFPHGARSGSTSGRWASLVDLAPTIAEAAGVHGMTFDGIPLQDPAEPERAEPVLAMSDGVIWGRDRNRFTPAALEKLDRVWGIAYGGRFKVLVQSETGATRAYDLDKDPLESRDVWAEEGPELGSLRDAAARVAEQIGSRPVAPLSREVEERLESWGYL
ncbi:MAG TPA: sulfatase-like hydrolase/transferase [Thermoplasmata archaeon]|nr:sulfatase-like hydrolase/transferase [Thermoplasmata archaeon]